MPLEIQMLIFYVIIFITLFISLFYLITFFESRKKKEKKEFKKALPITFVIPAYNEQAHITDTVNSVLNLDYPKNMIKIFIVDDGSTDNTYSISKKLAKKYKNIQVFHKENGGKASALNYGIERVKTELTAVLDSETILQPDILKEAIPLLENKKIAAVMGRLSPLNKKGFFTKIQIIEYAVVSFFRKLLSSISALPVTNAFSIFRTSFFRKYGSFDVGNLTEDFEIALRIQSHHYDIAYVSDSYGETIVPKTFSNLKRQRVRWNYGNFTNLYKYKRLFSPSYGDLGVFSLPSQVLIVMVIFALFGIGVYDLFSMGKQFIEHLMAGWIPQLNLSIFGVVLFFSDPKIIFGIISILISLLFFALIRRHVRERISFLNYLIYTFVYVWLTVYFYFDAVVRIIFKRPPPW